MEIDFAQLEKQFLGSQIATLRAAREKAKQYYLTNGLPTRHDEEWRYSSPANLLQRTFDYGAPSEISKWHQMALEQLSGNVLVFVNGYFSAQYSRIKTRDLRYIPLWQAYEQEATLINNFSASYQQGFAALNMALMMDGLYLHILAEQSIQENIHCVFITQASSPVMVFPRNLWTIESGSTVQIIEHYWGQNEHDHFQNAVTEINIHANAQVTHLRLIEEGRTSFHVSDLSVKQLAHSQFKTHTISLSGGWVRSDTHISLVAPGASVALSGLLMPKHTAHIDHHTTVQHLAPDTHSDEFYKGIMGNQSKGIFNGQVIVAENAKRSRAIQQSKNLLLSPHAEMNTKPELQIDTDDVQCAHGATVGQLDEQAIFYLQSRGIPLEEAVSLLTLSFAEDILARMVLSDMKEYVRHRMGTSS